jgi:hypothetical protein
MPIATHTNIATAHSAPAHCANTNGGASGRCDDAQRTDLHTAPINAMHRPTQYTERRNKKENKTNANFQGNV